MNKLTSLTAVVSLAITPIFSALAADGTWSHDSGSGEWSDPTRWAGDVAGGIGSIASFELPSVADDYDIELDTGVTLGELRQLGASWAGSSYRITGPGTLTFAPSGGGTAKIALSSTESSNSFLPSLLIESAVAGSNGLEISGSGRRQYVVWNPGTMGLTGGITLQNVGLQVASGTALGSNAITLRGSGLSFLGFSADSGNYGQSIVLDSSTGGFMNFVPHGSVSTDPPTHHLSGVISQIGGSRGVHYMTSTNTAGGTRFVVSGNNSYTGSTTISASSVAGVNLNTGPIVVRAKHQNAFGSGTNAVIQILSSSSGIELEGGITISGKTARLNGEGFHGRGSINSVGGDNTWSGNIVLRHGTDRGTAPTLGVESDTLTVTGTISDGNSSDGLHKVGDGTLILAQANTYATGTVIREGTVVADHNQALGTGEVTLDGGTLMIAAGRSVSNALSFGAEGGTLGGTGRLATALEMTSTDHRLAPGGGTLEIAGAQSWSALTYLWSFEGDELGFGYDQIKVDGALALSLTGDFRLDAHILNSEWLTGLADGESHSWTILSATELTGFDAGRWTLIGFDDIAGGDGQWTLGQDGQTITLSYQAIPEPASIACIALGAILCFGARSRKTLGH